MSLRRFERAKDEVIWLNIDDTTGMPSVLEDQYWRVVDKGDYGFRVQLRQKSRYWFDKTVLSSELRCWDEIRGQWDYRTEAVLNGETICNVAAFMLYRLSEWEKEKERTSALRDRYVGDYPPKSLS